MRLSWPAKSIFGMGGPSSPRIGVSKAKDLPRIFTITDSPSEIHAATLRKSFLKSATFAVFMRAGNTTFQCPSTPIQSHPCHTDEPPNPQANLIPDLLTRIPLPIHLHPQLRLLPSFFQPPPPITLSSSQSNARRGSPPAIRQALQRRLLRPSQRRRSPPPAPPGRSLRPHPIGPTPAHPRLFPRGTNIQLAAIPFDAIRGTPAASSTASSPTSSIAPTQLTGPASSAEFTVSATTMKDLLGRFAPTRVATEPQNPRRVFRPKEAFRPEAAKRKRFYRLLYVYSDSRIPSCSPSDSIPKSKGVWNVWPK